MRLRYLVPLFWAISLVVFLPALRGEFIMDDWAYITQNPAITGPAWPFRFWYSLTAATDYWPLSYSFYWLFYRLFGEEPLFYHLINLLLHTGNAVLVYLLAKRYVPRWSLVAALLFLVHPLHVQAAAWIIQFKTLLSTFAALATLLLILEKRERAAVGSFAVSLLAKSSSVFLPGVLWVMGVRGRRLWPFLGLSLVSGVTTLLANEWNFHEREAAVFHLSFLERPLLIVQNFVFYVSSFVVPFPLAYVYPFQPGWSAWRMGLDAILIVAVTVAIWRLQPSKMTRGFLLSYVVVLFPALGLVSIPNMKLSLVSDHWAYLPDVFLCLLVARALEKLTVRSAYALSATVLVVFAGLSFQHAKTFASEEAFWEQSRKLSPDSGIPYYNLGTVYDKRGDDQAALRAYETAVQHDPGHARAWYNLGRVHFRLGQPGYAREEFKRSLELDPKIPFTYIALAKVHFALLETREAERILREGLKEIPDSLEIQDELKKLNQ